MTVLEDSILIEVPPEKIPDFFQNMSADRYRLWHPEHHDFKWLTSPALSERNQFWFKETIGGKVMEKKVFFTRGEKNRYLEFVPTNPFLRLLLRRPPFGIEPIVKGCIFRAKIVILTGRARVLLWNIPITGEMTIELSITEEKSGNRIFRQVGLDHV